MIRLPEGVNINILIDDLRDLSWEAYGIFIKYSQILKDSKDKSNIMKNDNYDDPVTKADLEVNEFVIRRINSKYSTVNWEILSEENAKIVPKSLCLHSDWVWVLDPLDGTKDFLQGTSNYAMHLALNYMHSPILGVVLIPEKDELWIANGKDVWCEKKDKSKIFPNLLIKNSLEEMVLVTSKNHRNSVLESLIDKINFKDVIVMGSIGCKLVSILRGESDIYISLSLPGNSSPKDWDFSAPEVILKAAGGAITSIDNEELSYGIPNFEKGGIIVASNDRTNHENICSQIKKLIRENDLYPA